MLINFIAYTIGVPILAGLLSLFISDKLKALTRALALTTTLVIFAASIKIFIDRPVYWPAVPHPVFAVDAISSVAGLGASFFALVVTLYSCGFIEKSNGKYFGYLLMTLGSSLGAVYANDLIVLVVFWGLLAALLYLMVSMGGTVKASSSAKKALVIIGGTDALLIFAIGLIWKLSGTFFMQGVRIELDNPLAYAAYLCIAISAFAKAGAIPLHSWLPDVAEDGPAPVTAYLPASVDKILGIYLLAKASLSLFIMNSVSNAFLLFIGSVTIIVAVSVAMAQQDFKRMLGYCAVSQVGYMVIGIGTANPVGIAGGLFHMLNHAIYKSCIFLGAGAVDKQAGTSDLSKLGGMARYMPVTFLTFLIAAFSIGGIPPLSGFVSKWMVYQGIIESGAAGNRAWIVCLIISMFGGALTIAIFMKLLHSVFLGRPSAASAGGRREASFFMLLPMVILAILCLVFGIFAFSIPLPLFILPSIGIDKIKYTGIWEPTLATSLMIAGILVGLAVYFMIFPRRPRETEPFIGGEDLKRLDRVTGVEFYDTMKDAGALGSFYRNEEAKIFDLYYISKKGLAVFTTLLQKLHNGILPTYLVWCLLGMAVIFVVLFLR